LDGEAARVGDEGGLDLAPGETGLFVIDELERLSRPELLLGVLERARHRGGRIVLVGRGRPSDWARGQRDLLTRLDAAPRLEVSPPDEEILRKVIMKLFEDRQIRAPARIADYAAPRLPRRLAAAADFVNAVDAYCREAKAPVSIAAARRVLAPAEE